VRAWQDVLDRAAAVRRLGDTSVAGYTGLFRVRTRRETDHFYLVHERPGAAPEPPATTTTDEQARESALSTAEDATR
jgi:hypothetical protein